MRARRIGRWLRIGVLLTVTAVRPRWRPLLAGAVLTVVGLVERDSGIGALVVPGLLSFWYALRMHVYSEADRRRRAQLKRELAAYSTPAQRCDLEATLDQYPDAVTAEIRDILASQAVAPHIGGNAGGGWGRSTPARPIT